MSFTRILAIIAIALASGDVSAQDAAPRPVVAVMQFSNASLKDHATYEPFTVGLPGMLLTEMRANSRIQIVERERLRQVLEELKLTQTGEVDPATAARAGRILGAQHMIFGAFIIDRQGRLRIDARAVNVQTSEIEHVETVNDDEDNLLRAVQRLGQQLNQGLRLPSAETAPRRSEGARRGQVLADLKFARALQEEDRKNPTRAAQFYREFLAESPPDYAPRQRQEAEARIKVLAPGGSP
jgi:TolB-like protein